MTNKGVKYINPKQKTITGERITVPVTVARVAAFERQAFRGFGTEMVAITTMRDAAGNAIVVKSASFRAEVGETFMLRGTVKEHSEFRGEKQTVVQRATVVNSVLTTAADAA